MPRRRPRFSKLKQLLQDSKGSPSPNSASEGFLKYLTGVNAYTITNKTKTNGKKRGVVSVLPFNLPPANTTLYAASITKWSYDKQSDVGLNGTNCAQEKYDATKHKTNAGFYPALIRWRTTVGGPASNPNKVSQITKLPYNYTGNRGGSSPFGIKTAGDGEADRANTLIAEAKAVSTTLGATYVPEEWKHQAGVTEVSTLPAMT